MSDTRNGQRHDRSALILYGTETGNSQDVAEELGRITERLHFMTRVCEMDEVDIVCNFFVELNQNMLIWMYQTARSIKVYFCYIHIINYRTGRISKERKEILE